MQINKILLSLATCTIAAVAIHDASTTDEPESAVRLPGMAVDPYIGEIMWVPYNFAPRGWAMCDGQLLQVDQNSALFSLLGTTYGGDGRTTFGVPDLRGRMPMHAGSGPGLSTRRLGQKGGVETVTLTTNQIPNHTHKLHYNPTNTAGTAQSVLMSDKAFTAEAPEGTVDVVDHAGGSQSHDNMPPYLALHAVIATTGTYPSRN